MKRILIVVMLLGILFGLLGWRFVQKTAANNASKQLAASRKNAATVVNVSTARRRKIVQEIDGVGSMESPFTVNLSPNVSGRINFLQVREGDRVRKGDILIRIDPQQVEAMIAQAEANVAQAEQKLAQAAIVESSTATGIYSAINQNKALVASTGADYNEVSVTYVPTVNAAHEATVDAQNKVESARFQVQTTTENLNLSKANLEDAKAKYDRELKLYKDGYAAAQDLDDALAAEKVDEATVNANQKQVNASEAALVSAQAEEQAAANQEAIARKKGMSDIQDAKAKFTQSKATLETAVSNRAQIPAYSENLHALESAVLAAKGALKQAVAERAFLNVPSPIDGTVTQRLFDPGAEATPGSPILVLQSLEWLYLTVPLPVEDADLVRPGMNAIIRTDSLPGRTFHTVVADVNRAADPTSRQFMVRVKMNNGEHLFKPGMYAVIQLPTTSVDAPVTVPREAVIQNKKGGMTVTEIDSKNVAHVLPVKVGAQDPDYIQIVSGLAAGDKVVSLSYRPVKDKTKVVEGKIGPGNGKTGSRGGGTGGAAIQGVSGDDTQGSAPTSQVNQVNSGSAIGVPPAGNGERARGQ
jgi:RND family efflux transporter MFP subunit